MQKVAITGLQGKLVNHISLHVRPSQMQENALQIDDGSETSTLISRSTILIGASVLLLNSGVVIGISLGGFTSRPMSEICLATGLIGVVAYVGLQSAVSRKATLFGVTALTLVFGILGALVW